MSKRIGEVIPLMNTIPPKKYGGIEVIAQELSLGFAKKGYKIGVFCAKGSQLKETNIHLIESSPYPTIEDLSQNRKFEINEFLKVLSNQSNFDLFHFHYEPIVLNCTIDSIEFNFLNFIKKPILITFHNTTHIGKHIDFYKEHKNLWQYDYVFISKNQKDPLSFFQILRLFITALTSKNFLLKMSRVIIYFFWVGSQTLRVFWKLFKLQTLLT